jgi:hypothetical protein
MVIPSKKTRASPAVTGRRGSQSRIPRSASPKTSMQEYTKGRLVCQGKTSPDNTAEMISRSQLRSTQKDLSKHWWNIPQNLKESIAEEKNGMATAGTSSGIRTKQRWRSSSGRTEGFIGSYPNQGPTFCSYPIARYPLNRFSNIRCNTGTFRS